ncbi:AcrR family transcriptional regulator [Cytobacillus eiseniae]|uniref:AcrR family transcriptional regulator n=1 Tax=Cytobacillus eiseniae TaxID=762947 RepID=A0ABS4RET5_9BACI|nr:forespore capture DNA-binding protein RefZ [Cytobacillus eiseniae]MBP2241423.1 AcrR family transcriptional regulator [Cytobacillus eiseniae]
MGKNTKEAIIAASISLFNTNGFHGTSVRDIASKAKVNPANIAYYFNNKHGLLEYCLTIFFERYVAEIEEGYERIEQGATICLKTIARNILFFQYENIHLTRMILREITIDSQVVREIMSTYLMKERFYLNRVFERGMQTKEFRHVTPDYMTLQLKGLLNMPFLNSHYMSEVLHVHPNERYFAEKYLKEVDRWIDGVLCRNEYEPAYLAVN